MPYLTQDEAIQKRDELIDLGYTIVPGVMGDPFLSEVRDWSDEILDRMEVEYKVRYQGSDLFALTEEAFAASGREENHRWFLDPMADRLCGFESARRVLDDLMLEGVRNHGTVIILSKPPHGPPLYWHQDHMNWNHPESVAPWPIKVFLSYYLTDTARENGCLRVIPRTQGRRIGLHDDLPAAHGPEIQAIEDLDHPVFQDHPDAIDVPVKAGDLVVADSRVLHAAWPNQTNQRRTLILLWHDVFPYPSIPSWWEREVPEEYASPDLGIEVEGTRMPGTYLK